MAQENLFPDPFQFFRHDLHGFREMEVVQRRHQNGQNPDRLVDRFAAIWSGT